MILHFKVEEMYAKLFVFFFFTESQQQHINSSAMRDGTVTSNKNFHLEHGVKQTITT